MREHEGRAAFVTGAGSGIGLAVAQLLVERGARVAINDINASALYALAGRIGDRVIAAPADVTDAAALRAAVGAAADAFGGLDVLVTCAGIQRYGTVGTTTEQTWDEVFAVNVKGTFLAMQACLPHLRRSRGAVVIVSSVQATATQSNVAAYTASKGALAALTRAAAVDEAAHGVRVNSVAPGSVNTPMLRASAALFGDDVDGTVAQWGHAHPIGRVGTAQEVAEAVAFLASDQARFITGAELRVDGGLLSALAAALPTQPGA